MTGLEATRKRGFCKNSAVTSNYLFWAVSLQEFGHFGQPSDFVVTL